MLQTQLSSAKASLWPLIPPILRQTLPGASPEPRRSTSDLNQRYYGEAPASVRRDSSETPLDLR
jgi:hypothetical protein